MPFSTVIQRENAQSLLAGPPKSFHYYRNQSKLQLIDAYIHIHSSIHTHKDIPGFAKGSCLNFSGISSSFTLLMSVMIKKPPSTCNGDKLPVFSHCYIHEHMYRYM